MKQNQKEEKNKMIKDFYLSRKQETKIREMKTLK
jgi:hypothetical protein